MDSSFYEEMMKKLDELKDTDACPQDDVNNLITWNECTHCGKQFTLKEGHGNPTDDGFLCNKCFNKLYGDVIE